MERLRAHFEFWNR